MVGFTPSIQHGLLHGWLAFHCVCVCVVCVCVYVQVDQFESEVESIHSSTKKKKLDRDVRRMG